MASERTFNFNLTDLNRDRKRKDRETEREIKMIIFQKKIQLSGNETHILNEVHIKLSIPKTTPTVN